MEKVNDRYGSRLKEYKILGHLGLILLLVGIFFCFLTFIFDTFLIIGIMVTFIGFMGGIAGWVGYRDEMKKFGAKRIKTGWGYSAFVIAMIGLGLISKIPILSIILGGISVILGKKAYKLGDLEFGEIGIISGIICIISSIVLIVMFLLNDISIFSF